MKNQNKKDLIIYFAGGGMTGVFGAGVAKYLEEKNVYSRISAVYTASAGAMTAAYFLAKQTEFGASIYWENLTQNFISAKKFFLGMWQRFLFGVFGIFPSKEYVDALDIGYLMELARNKKVLDVKEVRSSEIPFFIKFVHPNSIKTCYVDTKNSDLLEMLEMSIRCFPYVHKIGSIGGEKLIDAANIEIIGFGDLRRAHPDKKIVIVLNRPAQKKIVCILKNIIEGKFMSWMFGNNKFQTVFNNAEKNLLSDIDKINKDENAVLVAPKIGIQLLTSTTNPKILKNAYLYGRSRAEEVLENFLK